MSVPCILVGPGAHRPPCTRRAAAQADIGGEADRLVRIDAVFPTAKIAPGRTELLGVRFRIAPKWHIYWRNPGESGSEPRITLELPKGFKAGPVVWPRPVIHASEWETTFGYDGEAMLFVPITAPPEIEATTVRIGIEAEWLVCKEVCLMGSGKTSLELPVVVPCVVPGQIVHCTPAQG